MYRRLMKAAIITLLITLPLAGCNSRKAAVTAEAQGEKKVLEVFAGAASKPPLEELAAMYKEKYGVEVNLTFGGSGSVLSQMKLSRQGDVYIPGSSDFMELAKKEGIVDPQTEKVLVYLLPAINVPKGNPQGIKTLTDLTRPGVRVGMARPETVCVGLYGVEILENAGLADQVRKNIVTYAESCEKTANLVALKQVDAVLGWDVFAKWDQDKIETVYLPPEQITRIGYIPAAVTTYSRQKELAASFVNFLTSDAGKGVFRKYGYMVDLEEARQFAPDAPVGGEYELPPDWRK
ncbi:Sulfate-binding protein [Moorella humiferrea]|uniref:Sulfate-binding protein n=1 Tax=Neomoorella humiferrea TaxID=676965 RepID=A0A2T0AKD2_9FIRM|nr:molybdate ABC transporter substrate-binding protein [Moorella humiferrea]PRR69029.1 Sulfate-binding protein precursor [Moorella humiferrea]